MRNVAIIETKPSRTNFEKSFNNAFEFDRFALCSDHTIKKVLKRDVDINFDPDNYEWVILVGADACKYFTKNASVTDYSGKIVEDKFLPVINNKNYNKIFCISFFYFYYFASSYV